MPFRNSYVILSKQFFNLFHAYARKNNMWILDQPLSPQLPDLLLDLRFMRRTQSLYTGTGTTIPQIAASGIGVLGS